MKMKRIWSHVFSEMKYRKYSLICLVLMWIVHQLACSLTLNNETLNHLLIHPQFLLFIGSFFVIFWVPQILNTNPPVPASSAAPSFSFSRGEKDAAKSLFILLFISGPIILLKIFSMVLNGASPAEIFLAMPFMLFMALFFVPFWLFALVLYESKLYYWVFWIYLLFPPISLIKQLFHLTHTKAVLFGSKPLIPTSVEAFQWKYTFWLLETLLFGLIILHQYLTKNTRRSVYLTVAAFLLSVTVNIAWPLGLFQNSDPVESISTNDIRIRDFEIHSILHYKRHHSKMGHEHYGIGGLKVHTFSYRCGYSGIPDNYLLSFKTQGDINIQFPDDTFTASSIVIRGGNSQCGKFRAMQTIFEPSRLVRGLFFFVDRSVEYKILGIPDDIVRRFSTAGGVVTGDLKLRLSQYAVAAAIPLEIGCRAQKGAEFIEIVDIKMKGRGYTVNTKIQVKDFQFFTKRRGIPVSQRDYFIWDDMVIVLHNKIKQEVLTVDSRGFADQVINNISNIENKRKQGSPLWTTKLLLNFTGDYDLGELDNYFPKIDETWLKHAELVALQEEDVGEVVVPMRIENLLFLDDRELLAERQGEPLQNITLPKDADAAQVREYLVKVLTSAETLWTKNNKDMFVDKLTKVGPDYIPLLGRMGKLYFSKYFVELAIDKLAGPGNKKQIIDLLEEYPGLISVVCKEGWQVEARPILVKLLEQKPHRCRLDYWVEAGFSLEDESLYPLLKRRLLATGDSLELYGMIKDLPGIGLADVMPRFWRQLKYNCSKVYYNDNYITKTIRIGLEWGYADAFDVALYFLDEPDLNEFNREAILTTLKEYLQCNKFEEDMVAWLKANREKLVFDPETRRFGLRGPGGGDFMTR